LTREANRDEKAGAKDAGSENGKPPDPSAGETQAETTAAKK